MSRRQSGFSLLEMLVAVTLLSVLAALVYGVLRLGMRTWEAGSERIAASDLTRIGWQFVHGTLGSAGSPPSRLPDDPGVHFIGSADSLEFVSELPAWLAGGGFHVLHLSLVDGSGSQDGRLEIEAIPWMAYDDPELDPAEVPRAVLAEDVEGLTFAYFGVGEQGGEATWLDNWSGRESLPQLVRMQVQLADGTAWPVLVAHPRLGQDRQFAGTGDGELFDPVELLEEAEPDERLQEFDDAL
jgi:general secretion pathway protein J